jgi:hypothetical protein
MDRGIVRSADLHMGAAPKTSAIMATAARARCGRAWVPSHLVDAGGDPALSRRSVVPIPCPYSLG